MDPIDLKPDLDRIHVKLDGLATALEEIKITAAVQTHQLGEHMRRTAQNEEEIKLLEMAMKPVAQHVANVNFLGKLVMAAVTVGSLLVGLIKLFGGR